MLQHNTTPEHMSDLSQSIHIDCDKAPRPSHTIVDVPIEFRDYADEVYFELTTGHALSDNYVGLQWLELLDRYRESELNKPVYVWIPILVMED